MGILNTIRSWLYPASKLIVVPEKSELYNEIKYNMENFENKIAIENIRILPIKY